MPVRDHSIDFDRDLLADFQPLRIKCMFRGAGAYCDERHIAVLVDDALYLKVEDRRAQYEQPRLLSCR